MPMHCEADMTAPPQPAPYHPTHLHFARAVVQRLLQPEALLLHLRVSLTQRSKLPLCCRRCALGLLPCLL